MAKHMRQVVAVEPLTAPHEEHFQNVVLSAGSASADEIADSASSGAEVEVVSPHIEVSAVLGSGCDEPAVIAAVSSEIPPESSSVRHEVADSSEIAPIDPESVVSCAGAAVSDAVEV